MNFTTGTPVEANVTVAVPFSSPKPSCIPSNVHIKTPAENGQSILLANCQNGFGSAGLSRFATATLIASKASLESRTVTLLLARPDLPQSILIGYDTRPCVSMKLTPAGIRHVQVIRLPVFGPKPNADGVAEGKPGYWVGSNFSTSIVHRDFGVTTIDTLALPPGDTTPGNLVTRTVAAADEANTVARTMARTGINERRNGRIILPLHRVTQAGASCARAAARLARHLMLNLPMKDRGRVQAELSVAVACLGRVSEMLEETG